MFTRSTTTLVFVLFTLRCTVIQNQMWSRRQRTCVVMIFTIFVWFFFSFAFFNSPHRFKFLSPILPDGLICFSGLPVTWLLKIQGFNPTICNYLSLKKQNKNNKKKTNKLFCCLYIPYSVVISIPVLFCDYYLSKTTFFWSSEVVYKPLLTNNDKYRIGVYLKVF